MGMTMTQKIIAAHAVFRKYTQGQLVTAKVDMVLSNDIPGRWPSAKCAKWAWIPFLIIRRSL